MTQTATLPTITAGAKYRLTADTSSHKLPIGSVVTAIEPHEGRREWLVTIDPDVTEWQSTYAPSRGGKPLSCRYAYPEDMEPVVEFGIGDLVRLKSNTNSTHFKIGDVFTLVGHETEAKDYFLGSSDVNVQQWDYNVCSNVFVDDLELVESAADRRPVEGDKVLTLPVREFGKYHTDVRGKVGTYVRAGGGLSETYGYVKFDDGTQRTWGGDEFDFFDKDLRVLIPVPEPVVPVTEADIITLSEAFHAANKAHERAEEVVDSYGELLSKAEAVLVEAATEREEAFAALQDALTKFKN